MTYRFNTRDLGYHSCSAEVEAFRRALEIRQHSRAHGSEYGQLRLVCEGVEVYVWKTPLAQGGVEVETVSVDEEAGIVTYELQTQHALAS